jgi:superfamily II DNA or RNA helicase
MNKFLDNRKAKVSDELLRNIEKGARLSVVSAYFTIFAYEKLKDALNEVDSLRFIFVNPTFTKKNEETREFYLERLSREKMLSGNEFEIKLRNELLQSKVARECADWIRKKVQFRSLKKADPSHSKMIHIQNQNSTAAIQGSVDFTSSGLGFTTSRRMEMSTLTDDTETTKEMLDWFDDIWGDDTFVEDVTQEVLKSIETIYKENTPELLYFVTLYNIFKDYLEDLDEESIIQTKTGFKNSLVWNKLYKFQKDGVLGAIDKLEKYNGCIIADSVGLGKTFEALAVIKYYELRNSRVLVIPPKRLRDNWEMYRVNDLRNVLASDRFNYDIVNHSDLTRQTGKSGDLNLATLNWGNYDLVVIDESHNFRNNDARRNNTKTRYAKLMEDIIKSGVKTKVLMLSATPVNNKMNDLKNQVGFITEGNDNALLDHGIPSVATTLRLAQQQFNQWTELSKEDRTIETLLSKLNVDYFKLLDLLTIARSRKHIEKYYNLQDIGKFPQRLKPINIQSKIDIDDQFPSFENIFEEIGKLQMAVYSPLQYVFPEFSDIYELRYDIKLNGGSSFKQTDREKSIVKLMRINILKRMESSIHSYRQTLKSLIERVEYTLDRIQNYSDADLDFDLENLDEALDGDDTELELMTIGVKIRVNLVHVDRVRWQQDLQYDLYRLKSLYNQSVPITAYRDAKLSDLKNLIQNKIQNPVNINNNKIIIFSAFADTASYIYDGVADWILQEFGLHTAFVSGGNTLKTTLKSVPKDMNSFLTFFSPRSKEKAKVYPDITGEIDILIATDCVSEGQNLQDCDYLVNYDIHWNPVRIIQRFGRIDRIGSVNTKIQLVNFWPDIKLDAYINLEQRVRGKMMLLNTSATGEDDILSETDTSTMNDMEFRKRQLDQLKNEVVDLEDISGNISITDLTMNDFKMDLMGYLKDHREELDKSSLGIYAITTKGSESLQPGVIFTLKQVAFSQIQSKEPNAIHPYYMVYIQYDGTIRYSHIQTKYILDIYKKLCYGHDSVHQDLVKVFNQETKEARDMSQYTELLQQSISHIIGQKQEVGVQELFQTFGQTSISNNHNLTGNDDFELISFLIIK